jgi:phosphate transport system ATP-binding protein
MGRKREGNLLERGKHDAEPPEQDLPSTTQTPIKIEVHHLNVFSGNQQVLHDVNISIGEGGVTALTGPSGSGKSTFLRALNRLHDLTPTVQVAGKILVDGEDITQFQQDGAQLTHLHLRMSLIAYPPNPFPRSIFDNVAHRVRLMRTVGRSALQEIVEQALRRVALWDTVKDRLKQNALQLAPGQQQLLCLARVLAEPPEVLLLDEPCGMLDPLASRLMEELFVQLGQQSTVVMATVNSNLARCVADRTCFFLDGYLVQCETLEQALSSVLPGPAD